MRRPPTASIAAWALAWAALVLARPVSAADPAALDAEVRTLRAKVSELEKSRDQALQQIDELRGVVTDLQAQMPAVQAENERRSTAPSPAGRGDAPAGDVAPAEEVATDRRDQRRYSAERVILEEQRGVLLPAGQLVVQPGFQYTNVGRNLIDVSGFFPIPGLIFGRIETAAIERDFYTTSLDLRYGLHRRAELEVNVPYSYRSDRSETDIGGSNERVVSVRDDGIGDVTFGANAQLFYQRKWWPDTVLNLLVRAPTGADPFDIEGDELAFGTGTWGINGGFTMVRSLDPAVLYGSIRYLWDLEHETHGLDVDLGDGIEYTAGLAFSLNERLAFTTSLQHTILGRAKIDGDKINGSDLNAARLFLGGSYRMTETATANLSLGIGLTDDAPDFSIELTMPLRLPWELPHL